MKPRALLPGDDGRVVAFRRLATWCCDELPCTTTCGSTGTIECPSGTCVPPPETCNGVDDDCDDVVDEGFPCSPGETGACTTTCSSQGTRRCLEGCVWDLCVPPPETCNGVDDDCD